MSKETLETGSAPKNSKSPNPSINLSDMEMVFGVQTSPKLDPRSAVHTVTNERTNGKTPTSTQSSDGNTKLRDVEVLEPKNPLLEPDRGRPKPPLAGPEVDDLDKKPSVNGYFPGIDDGLLEPENNKPGHGSEEGELPEGGSHTNSNDEGVGTDEGKWLWPATDEPDYPYDGVNGIGTRFGIDDRPISPVPGSIPDVNTYQQKKNLAQGMMDLALLSANANQLRYVIESSSSGHAYYYSSIAFISISIILQVAVGIGLILNSRYDVKDEKDICKADKINNLTVLGIFLVTIVNVFITAFSVAPTSTGVPALTVPTG